MTLWPYMNSKQPRIQDADVSGLYEQVLFPLFLSKHHALLSRDKHKHIFEVGKIVQSIGEKPRATVLDFGCGAGVNAILLSTIYGIQVSVVDRFDEFEVEHKRTAGDVDIVTDRLESVGVQVIRGSFDNLSAALAGVAFDIVTSFDVIEHIGNGPSIFVTALMEAVRPSGSLLLGTPNQQHIFNRVKALAGLNTWEDFGTWYEGNPFYGHVRELLVSDLKQIARRVEAADEYFIHSSNYVYRDRLPLAGAALDTIMSLFPSLSYYLLLELRRS